MEVDITDKGERYLDKLFKSVFPVNTERQGDNPKLFDFIVLQSLSMNGSNDPNDIIRGEEEELVGDGNFTKSSIRRLFEAGYIEQV